MLAPAYVVCEQGRGTQALAEGLCMWLLGSCALQTLLVAWK